MKKVLILTASTGEGHNQAAKSLADKFHEHGYEPYTMDLFKETSKALNTLMADGYKMLANNLPTIYGVMYRIFNRKSFNNRFLRYGLIVVKNRVLEEIKTVEPDMIVSTHPFGVGIISDLKERGKIDTAFMSVVTDFKAHYAYISPYVDAYITGSEYTKETLIERQIPAEKIFPFGIPVKSEFQNCSERPMPTENKEKFEVLIMGGSMGSKDIAKVVKTLTSEADSRYHLTVVCGKNESLKEMLEERYETAVKANKLSILGFTKNIPQLMDTCDVIVTKPGGLTTTEALSKQIPMIIPFAIPGQEIENTEFLVKSGAAIHVEDLDDLKLQLDGLLKDRDLYATMIENMQSISKHYSVDKIVDLSNDLILEEQVLV